MKKLFLLLLLLIFTGCNNPIEPEIEEMQFPDKRFEGIWEHITINNNIMLVDKYFFTNNNVVEWWASYFLVYWMDISSNKYYFPKTIKYTWDIKKEEYIKKDIRESKWYLFNLVYINETNIVIDNKQYYLKAK